MTYLNSKIRICYENGNLSGKKIYEAKQLCHCENCINRFKWRNEALNCVTAKTYDENKIEEMLHFLDNWTCKNDKRWLETEYITF